MRRFHLERDEDESGVSGTGIVAEGVLFSSGKVVLSWLTEHTSLGIYDDLATAIQIHGHGGKTRIVFRDDKPSLPSDPELVPEIVIVEKPHMPSCDEPHPEYKTLCQRDIGHDTRSKTASATIHIDSSGNRWSDTDTLRPVVISPNEEDV